MESTAHFNLMWASGLVGAGLPLLISFVKRSTWSTQAKRVLAVIASVIAGSITVGIQTGLEFDANFFPALLHGIVNVYIASAVTYQNFWKDTTIEKALESVGSPKAFDEGYNAGDSPHH